jgi:hypothetical protein
VGIDSPENINRFLDNLQAVEPGWDPANPESNAGLVEATVNQSLLGQGRTPTGVDYEGMQPHQLGASGPDGITLNQDMLTADGVTGDLVNTAVHEHVHSAQWQIAQQIKERSMVQDPDGTWRPPTDEENDIYENLAGINKGYADLMSASDKTTDPGTHLGQQIGSDDAGNPIHAAFDPTVSERYFDGYEALPEEEQARDAGNEAERMWNERQENLAGFAELPSPDAMS